MTNDLRIKEIHDRKNSDETCVFTNGCFDIIHAGHIHLLKKAREMGDFLVVGLNSDNSVRNLKGEERPINDQLSRQIVLESIRYVDYVFIFDEPTPLELIKKIEPHILVKGGDYLPEQVVGKCFVESTGGRVEIVKLLDGYSTSGTIDDLSKTGSCD